MPGWIVRRIVSIGVLVGALACGSGSDPDVQTRRGPTAFHARSGVFFTNSGSLGDVPVQILLVYLLDRPLWCTPIDAGTPPDTLAGISVNVVKFGTALPGPGTYTVRTADGQPIEGATAVYYTVVPGQFGDTLDVTTGVLRLTRVTDAAVEGQVDLTLEDGTVLSGSFLGRDVHGWVRCAWCTMARQGTRVGEAGCARRARPRGRGGSGRPSDCVER